MRFRSVSGLLAALLGLCLLAAAPAAAQHSRFRSVHSDAGRTLEMEGVGRVEFSADDRGVQRLSPDGRLTIEERLRGRGTRRVEFRPGAGGRVERAYFANGRERAADAEAEAWIARAVLEAIRRSGIGAEERVARFLARGGPDAVLEEIRQIPGDGARARYLRIFLATHPAPRDAARALRLAADGIASDGEMAALLVAAEESVDVDRDPVGDAWFAAAATVGSDGERARVLTAPLRRGVLGEGTRVAILRSASSIGSDGERAALLGRVADGQSLASGAVRAAFFEAVSGIGSDGERGALLGRVLARHGGDLSLVRETVRSARGIGSDGEKAGVLMRVPPAALRDDGVASDFAATMKTIGSDGELSRVALHLLEARSAEGRRE